MIKATSYFTAEEKQTIEQAIGAAEEKTSAELVCAIATESGRYDRAEAMVGLIGALLMLAVGYLIFLCLQSDGGSWGETRPLPFGWQCLCVVVGFVLGNVAASFCHPLRRPLVSRDEMDEETLRAAQYVFGFEGLTRTRGRGGLLIYVSLHEHRVIVLADEGLKKAMGQAFLDKMRDHAVNHLRAGERVETFTETIETALGELEQALPRRPDDKDELPDHLLLIHPRP